MESRDLNPAPRPDLSMSPDVLHSTAKPGRRASHSFWMWLIILILAVLYAISPIDFIPDLIPVLGWIDDVVITLSAIIIALPKILRR